MCAGELSLKQQQRLSAHGGQQNTYLGRLCVELCRHGQHTLMLQHLAVGREQCKRLVRGPTFRRRCPHPLWETQHTGGGVSIVLAPFYYPNVEA